MALLRYDPWSSLASLQDEMNQLFKQRLSLDDDNSRADTVQWAPSVDIKEEDNRFLIHADIPGVAPDDIEISIDKGTLTIKGERESEKKDERDGYSRIERVSGSFYRRFSLPDTADLDSISATNKHGVLSIEIPKREASGVRKVEVKGE